MHNENIDRRLGRPVAICQAFSDKHSSSFVYKLLSKNQSNSLMNRKVFPSIQSAVKLQKKRTPACEATEGEILVHFDSGGAQHFCFDLKRTEADQEVGVVELKDVGVGVDQWVGIEIRFRSPLTGHMILVGHTPAPTYRRSVEDTAATILDELTSLARFRTMANLKKVLLARRVPRWLLGDATTPRLIPEETSGDEESIEVIMRASLLPEINELLAKASGFVTR